MAWIVGCRAGDASLDGAQLEPGNLAAAGIEINDAHKVGCNRDLETLLRSKFGVAILPQSSFKSERLTHLPFPAIDQSRTVAVYSIAGRPRSREATAMLALVRAADWDSSVAA